MATEVRNQLDRKMSAGPRPGPLGISSSLYPDHAEQKKRHMVEETKETLETLRAAGLRATVVVEAD